MIKTLSFIEKLEAKTNLVYIFISLLILIVALNIINGEDVGVSKLKQITNGVGILDMEPGYSIEKAYSILDSQGTEGRYYYLKRIIPMDFVFPLIYMAFYCSIILFLLKLIHPRNELLHLLAFVPVLNTFFDYLENITIIRLLVRYPQKEIFTVKLANIC